MFPLADLASGDVAEDDGEQAEDDGDEPADNGTDEAGDGESVGAVGGGRLPLRGLVVAVVVVALLRVGVGVIVHGFPRWVLEVGRQLPAVSEAV